MLTLSDIHMLGTHNSYHIAPKIRLYGAWSYSHLPLLEQLSTQNIRNLELDIYFRKNIFYVEHIPFFDSKSTCRTLEQCLVTLHSWSLENPHHSPIIIFLELKDFDTNAHKTRYLTQLSSLLTQHIDASSWITPSEVLETSDPTVPLSTHITWPSLEGSRGHFLIAISALHTRSEALYSYVCATEDPRVLFVTSTTDQPFSKIRVYDNPIRDFSDIQEATSQGYLVRTRSDDMRDPRHNLFKQNRLQAAIKSGAQIISTDSPETVSKILEDSFHLSFEDIFVF